MEVSDRRVIIYPAYIDSRKTVAQGRRIPKELAIENPSMFEIFEAAGALGLKSQMEDKAYSRDYMQRGRVRVALRNEAGKPANSEVPSRRDLLIKICAAIPETQARAKAAQLNPTIPIIQGVAMPKVGEKAAKEEGTPEGSAKSAKKGKKGKR